MKRSLLLALTLPLGLSAPACVDLQDIAANFIDTPFGDVAAEVTTFEREELEPIMDTVILRFRSYLELREALPFSELVVEECLSNINDFGSGFSFNLDVACAFSDLFAPIEGAVSVTQEQVSTEVTELDVIYRDVLMGDLAVDGVEHVSETAGDDGASVRSIDVVQNGVELKYDFRIGLVGEDQTVIDYLVDTPQGTVIARVTNPASPGAQATVILTGTDGSLECEVRNTPWSIEEPAAKGFCDNGATFGIPDTEPTTVP